MVVFLNHPDPQPHAFPLSLSKALLVRDLSALSLEAAADFTPRTWQPNDTYASKKETSHAPQSVRHSGSQATHNGATSHPFEGEASGDDRKYGGGCGGGGASGVGGGGGVGQRVVSSSSSNSYHVSTSGGGGGGMSTFDPMMPVPTLTRNRGLHARKLPLVPRRLTDTLPAQFMQKSNLLYILSSLSFYFKSRSLHLITPVTHSW